MKTCCYFLLSIVAFSTAAHAELTTRIGASYYYIGGGSALVLTAQMDNEGPAGVDGRKHPARTKWDVQWRFRHNIHGDVCKMEKVMVIVGVTTVRPRWREQAQGRASLRERWKGLVKAVERNEAFHKQQALDAGNEIDNALTALAPEKTCQALTEAANSVASEILGTHQNASREYDLSNDFGRKNGASLI